MATSGLPSRLAAPSHALAAIAPRDVVLVVLFAFVLGALFGACAALIARRERDLYRRATGQTVDFTHRSRS